MARFGTGNEHGDWETAHHVFTYANAVHQALKRSAAGDRSSSAVEVVRGVFHGAMAVYLARYLNVPPARLPGEGGDALDDLPADGRGRCARLCSTPSTAGIRSSWRHGWSPAISCSATRHRC